MFSSSIDWQQDQWEIVNQFRSLCKMPLHMIENIICDSHKEKVLLLERNRCDFSISVEIYD